MKDLSQIEAAERQRDARLRRVLLMSLHRARVSPKGGLHGRTLIDQASAATLPGDEFQGDVHALGLARDLVGKGYVSETDERTRRGQLFGLDYLFFRITAKGSDLADERIPADPMVEDERLLEE